MSGPSVSLRVPSSWTDGPRLSVSDLSINVSTLDSTGYVDRSVGVRKQGTHLPTTYRPTNTPMVLPLTSIVEKRGHQDRPISWKFPFP